MYPRHKKVVKAMICYTLLQFRPRFVTSSLERRGHVMPKVPGAREGWQRTGMGGGRGWGEGRLTSRVTARARLSITVTERGQF